MQELAYICNFINGMSKFEEIYKCGTRLFKFYQQEEKENREYAVACFKVIRITANFLSLAIVIKSHDSKAPQLLTCEALAKGSQILEDLYKGKKTFSSFKTWREITSVIRNVGQIYVQPQKLKWTKWLDTLALIEEREPVTKRLTSLFNSATLLTAQSYNYIQGAMFTPSLETIELQLTDIEYDEEYSEIPKRYENNYVFKKFTCGVTGEAVRYPVIVMRVDRLGRAIAPIMTDPLILFERKVLLDRLKNIFTSTYPPTGELIQMCQLKEHLGVRKIIEEELKRVGHLKNI